MGLTDCTGGYRSGGRSRSCRGTPRGTGGSGANSGIIRPEMERSGGEFQRCGLPRRRRVATRLGTGEGELAPESGPGNEKLCHIMPFRDIPGVRPGGVPGSAGVTVACGVPCAGGWVCGPWTWAWAWEHPNYQSWVGIDGTRGPLDSMVGRCYKTWQGASVSSGTVRARWPGAAAS